MDCDGRTEALRWRAALPSMGHRQAAVGGCAGPVDTLLFLHRLLSGPSVAARMSALSTRACARRLAACRVLRSFNQKLYFDVVGKSAVTQSLWDCPRGPSKRGLCKGLAPCAAKRLPPWSASSLAYKGRA